MSQTNHLPLAVLMLFLCGAVAAQEKALPQTAKLLPPETVLLVEVADFNALQKQFAKTSIYKFCTDPLMAPFVEDFKTKWPDKLRMLAPQFGDAIGGIDALPQGRVAFAMVLNEQTKDANEPPFLMITQWGNRIPDIKEAVDKTVEKAVNEGSHRKTEDYRGAGIITITSGGSEQVSYTFIDDSLIISADPGFLKFVVAHLKGAESPTLADDADYISSLKATGPYHDIDYYVNVKQIVKTALAESKQDKARTIVVNLGLENVTTVGVSLGLGREPAQPLSGKVLIKINGSKRGICKMLDMKSAALKIPRFVPASACAAMVLNVDIKKAYEELANILASFSPQAGAMMAMPLIPPSPDGEAGLELKRDVIDHTGSQIVVAQSIENKVTENAPPTETVIAIAVGNRQAIEKSLATLHSKLFAMGRPDAQRELLGHTIYVVGPAGFPFMAPGKTPMQTPPPTGGMPLPSIAFTVTGTHLIFGSEAAVERAIRTLSSSEAATLDSAEWFALGKSAIPSSVGLASLQDNAAASRPAWELMRNIGKAAKAGPGPSMSAAMGPNSGLMLAQTGFGLFDFSLLPEFDKVRKYFGVSASYGVSRPDGFYFEFKHIDSAELK